MTTLLMPCFGVVAVIIYPWALFLYRSVKLKLGLNEHRGYRAPHNVASPGHSYLYFGFIPVNKATKYNQQGLRVCLI